MRAWPTCRALEAVREAMAAGVPGVIGVHLEGPFLSPKRPGIHPARHIRKMTPEDAATIGGAGVPVLITLAPEEAEAGLIEGLRAAGVTVFAGHTEATFEEMGRAVEAGVTGVTHLWNAMSQLQGRAPGVVGAALTDGRLMAGIIADGVHVHAANLRLAAEAGGGAAVPRDGRDGDAGLRDRRLRAGRRRRCGWWTGGSCRPRGRLRARISPWTRRCG